MSQHTCKISFSHKDIYHMLPAETKVRFAGIEITDIALGKNGNVEIKCALLEDNVLRCPYMH